MQYVGALRISHLLLANDTFICCQASWESIQGVQLVFDIYGVASGQDINVQNSVAVFSKNVAVDAQEDLASILGMQVEAHHAKYLGLPLVIRRSKRAIFSSLRDRVWKKIQRLNEKTLSQASKRVLIKTVIQAIPMYAMSVFKLSDVLLKDLQAMIVNYEGTIRKNGRSTGFDWNACVRDNLTGDLDSKNSKP